MVLRCLGRPGSALKNTTMYKNQVAQAPLRDGSDFRVHGAMLRDNGKYHCKADKEGCCSVVSNAVEIQVQGKARVISETGPSQGSLRLGPRQGVAGPHDLGRGSARDTGQSGTRSVLPGQVHSQHGG